MSITFPNGESVKQAVLEELQNLLSSDNEVLKTAERRMQQLEYTDGYGVYLTEIVMNQSLDLAARQLACVMVTRYVESYWGGNVCELEVVLCTPRIASDQAKRAIRNILPNGLYDPSSKIRSSVAHTISTIAAIDWPEHWPEFFDIIIKCLGGNEDSIHGGIQVLEEFPYDQKHIKELGQVVFSEVQRIFDSDNTLSIKIRALSLKVLRPLILAICIKIISTEEQGEVLNAILGNFTDKLLHYLCMNNSIATNFRLRADIMKLLTFIINEIAVHIDPYVERIMPIVWQLLTQVADTYVKVIINRTEPNPFPTSNDEDEDELTNFNTMILQIFDFIQCIVMFREYRYIIKPVLTDLIYIAIVYIQVSEDQLEDWNEDPEKFVEDEDESGVDMTIRLSGQDVLLGLNQDFGAKLLLPALQEAVRRHMNVAEAEKTAGNANWWKIHEACMVAVHTYRESILESEEYFDLKNYLTLVRGLINFPECGHLVGRALWTLSTYSKSKLYNEQMLAEILEVTLQSLAPEKSIVMKICAVRAISGFMQSHENSEEDGKRALLQSKLPGFVDGILDMIPGCKCSILALLLESLTAIIMFDTSFAGSVQNKLIPLSIAVFLKYPEDPFILEILQDMVKALSQNPLCLHPLQEKFIPTIVSILNLQSNNDHVIKGKQDVALDMLTTIVKYTQPPLSDALVEIAFPAMIDCVLRSGDDHCIMVAGGECLRALISVAPEQIYTYKNGEGLNYVMQVTTMLLNPMNTELTAGQSGRLVITIITKLGNMLGDNVELLLKAVISKMQLVECLKVAMSLVIIFAYLFLTQMDAVLNFLTTVPGPTGEVALQFVMTNWLSRQTCFYGAYERKVTIMALCKLFEYGVTTQDSRVTSINFKELVVVDNDSGVKTRSQTAGTEEWVTIPALVKIFKLLINEWQHLKEVEDGEESDTDQDSNDEDTANIYGKPPDRKSPQGRFVSHLYFPDEDEDAADAEKLKEELLQDPFVQTDIQENLTKFLQNFSNNEHFGMFFSHLNDNEKNVLKSIQEDTPAN